MISMKYSGINLMQKIFQLKLPTQICTGNCCVCNILVTFSLPSFTDINPKYAIVRAIIRDATKYNYTPRCIITKLLIKIQLKRKTKSEIHKSKASRCWPGGYKSEARLGLLSFSR